MRFYIECDEVEFCGKSMQRNQQGVASSSNGTSSNLFLFFLAGSVVVCGYCHGSLGGKSPIIIKLLATDHLTTVAA